jgi:hypothetical protein
MSFGLQAFLWGCLLGVFLWVFGWAFFLLSSLSSPLPPYHLCILPVYQGLLPFALLIYSTDLSKKKKVTGHYFTICHLKVVYDNDLETTGMGYYHLEERKSRRKQN